MSESPVGSDLDGLDIVVQAPSWEAHDLDSLAQRAVNATLAHVGVPGTQSELTVLGCDDTRIAALNAEFRDKPTPTNVLSWPAQPLAPPRSGSAPPRPVAGPDGAYDLGDIAISYDTCAREARESATPFPAHVTHLIVHGTLHLLGYDHETDADAALMEGIEVEILGNLGIDDPYTANHTITGAL